MGTIRDDLTVSALPRTSAFWGGAEIVIVGRPSRLVGVGIVLGLGEDGVAGGCSLEGLNMSELGVSIEVDLGPRTEL